MTSKRRENKNLVSFICFSFLVISFSQEKTAKKAIHFFKYLRIFKNFLNVSETSKYLKKYSDISVKAEMYFIPLYL